MKLLLKRQPSKDGCTLGDLHVDSEWLCYTLEDEVRDGPKVAGKTAIPTGAYTVVIDLSTRFGRLMPHVLNVPGFTGIRIHPGNTAENTDGCILVGNTKGTKSIGQSRAAYSVLFAMLSEAKRKGESIMLTIE
jgi:hypothetical protein